MESDVMTKVNKLIWTHRKNAKQGNLNALYELHKHLKFGIECEPDLKEAQKIYHKAVSLLSFSKDKYGIERPINPFRLEKLNLYSFKQFEELELVLDPFTTVLIGDNGAGKSSILDAIAKFFSITNNRIVGKGKTGKTIEDWEIKIGSLEPAELIANFRLGQKTYYSGTLVRGRKGMTTNKSSHLVELSSFSNMLRDFNTCLIEDNASELNIPLLASYSVERTSVKAKHAFNFDVSLELGLESRFDAIDKSVLDGTGNLNEFLEWFIKLDN